MAHLSIEVKSREADLRYGDRHIKVTLTRKPLGWAVERLIGGGRRISGITLSLKDVSFSTTRQVVATVNVLAWMLDVKINGVKQLTAVYSGQPNITKLRQ